MSDCFDHWSDALDRMLQGEEEDYPRGGDYHTLECLHCGEDDVEWKQLPSGKWWLHEYNEKTDDWDISHKCKKVGKCTE